MMTETQTATTYTETGFGAYFLRFTPQGEHEYAQPAVGSNGQDLRVIYCFTETEAEQAEDLADLPWDDAHRDRVIDQATNEIVDAGEDERR